MRSNNRSFWLLLAAVLLFVGIYPFTSPVDGEGVVPAARSQADSAPLTRAEAQDLLRSFADEKQAQLLRDILEEEKKQTKAMEEGRDAIKLNAQTNQKIYELIRGENEAGSGQAISSGIPADLKPRLFIDPKKVYYYYTSVDQKSPTEIEIRDKGANLYRWSYEDGEKILKRFSESSKNWVRCEVVPEEESVRPEPGGLLVHAPSFPIPEVLYYATAGSTPTSSATQSSPGKVSIHLDPGDLTERYKVHQLSDHQIVVADKFGNGFMWQYNANDDKLELLYLSHQEGGVQTWTPCLFLKEEGLVELSDNKRIVTPKFPIPHIQKPS